VNAQRRGCRKTVRPLFLTIALFKRFFGSEKQHLLSSARLSVTQYQLLKLFFRFYHFGTGALNETLSRNIGFVKSNDKHILRKGGD